MPAGSCCQRDIFQNLLKDVVLVAKTKTSHGTQKILQGMVSRKAKSHDTSTNPPLPYPSQRRLNKKVFLATRRALDCLVQALILHRRFHWTLGNRFVNWSHFETDIKDQPYLSIKHDKPNHSK